VDEYLYLWAQWGILNYKQYQNVIKTFGDLKRAWRYITPTFLRQLQYEQGKIERAFIIKKQIDFEFIVNQFKRLDAHLLFVEDDNYPSILKEIEYPPVFLFVRGQLPFPHKSMAVVGTRKMTPYGDAVTTKFVSDLVLNDFVIVSGLAYGVDACAHQTTLNHKGITVAVLGSGVDRITPTSNYRLAQNIISSGGAVISEYPFASPPLKHHFPQRNRIIAGLSCGVLVTEGGERSGALITAGYANSSNREVFAVPNAITHSLLSGTNKLIKNSEAKLVESIGDILNEYRMVSATNVSTLQFTKTEKIILDILSHESKSIDDLAMITVYNVSKLSEVLIRLQLKGAAKQVGQKWIVI